MNTQRLMIGALCLMLATAAVPDELRDPMRPGTTSSAQPPRDATTTLRLQAIMGTDASRLAIVNGQLVRVGDSVGGAKIVSIAADHVRFSRKRRSGLLRLAGAIVKGPSE